MRAIDPVRVGLLCGLAVFGFVSGTPIIDVSLRSSDFIDIDVPWSAAVAHSGVLRRRLLARTGKVLRLFSVPVPEAASHELHLLVDFMSETAVGDVCIYGRHQLLYRSTAEGRYCSS